VRCERRAACSNAHATLTSKLTGLKEEEEVVVEEEAVEGGDIGAGTCRCGDRIAVGVAAGDNREAVGGGGGPYLVPRGMGEPTTAGEDADPALAGEAKGAGEVDGEEKEEEAEGSVELRDRTYSVDQRRQATTPEIIYTKTGLFKT
jgi:hypothetical protein